MLNLLVCSSSPEKAPVSLPAVLPSRRAAMAAGVVSAGQASRVSGLERVREAEESVMGQAAWSATSSPAR